MTDYQKQAAFIAQAAAMAAAHTPTSAWLANYRSTQQQAFANSTFPHAQVEHFKYNRLDTFAQHNFSTIAKAHTAAVTNADIPAIADLTDHSNHAIERVVFVDGQYAAALSQTTQLRITPFADASATQQTHITAALRAQDIQHNPFIVLNAALTDNGVLIEIDNTNSHALVEIIYITTAAANHATTAQQVVFDIAENAQATAISRSITIGSDAGATLSTARFIANIGAHAQFTHYHLQLEASSSLHFGSLTYNLQTTANLDAFYAATGSRLKKLDIAVNHLGQHTHAKLNGLYAATDNQQVDYHTTINHTVPNGTTNENVRGIINGAAEGVFNGRIHIHPDAQKTLAELSNKNLLLSDDGVIHTKPELEIYADDVVCAHGATISRIDGDSLYYLLARGITKAEAEKMLSFAFFDALLADIQHQAIAAYIRPILVAGFSHTREPHA